MQGFLERKSQAGKLDSDLQSGHGQPSSDEKEVLNAMLNVLLPLLIVAADPSPDTDRVSAEAIEVRAWDFEAGDDRNYDAWPDHWTRRRGRGFPTYLPIQIQAYGDLAQDAGTPGATPRRQEVPPTPMHCLVLGLDGGAAVAQSPSVEVSPQFGYVLKAYLRTEGLQHDRAFITLTFFDSEQNPLEVHQSSRYCNLPTWRCVTIGPVMPAHPDIRSAVITLHLEPTAEADLSGKAVFDDIWLGSLPRIAVETNSRTNVYTTKDVEVTCRVSGFSQPNPRIRFELRDVFGQPLSMEEMPMTSEFSGRDRGEDGASHSPASTTSSVFSGLATWRPTIEENGYYQVRISIPEHTGHVCENLVVMDSQTPSKAGEFGWSLPRGDQPLSLNALPGLLGQVGINWVKFPVWYDDRNKERAEDLAWFAERLNAQGIELVGMLDRPPATMRDMFGQSDLLPIAEVFKEPQVWHPAIDPVMTRLSLKVRWWQLGADRDTSFVNFPGLEQKVREIRDGLNRFGSEVNLGLAWRSIDETPVIDQPPWSFLNYTADPPLTEDELGAYLAAESVEPVRRWIGVEPLRAERYSLKIRARDLVVRMLAAKVAQAEGVFVPDPFDPDHGLMDEDGSPGKLLLPWRTTALAVSNAQYLGSINLPQGSRNHVFLKNNRAVMFVWNDRPVREVLYLGEDVKQRDLWGRSRPTRVVESDGIRKQEIHVDTLPVIITGLNPHIAKWRMAFRYETAELASVFGQDQLANFRFTNTFPTGVSGKMTLHPPLRVWEVDPRVVQFKLASGKQQRAGVHVVLGANATSGRQAVPVRVELTADRTYAFVIYRDIHVGLGDVEIEMSASLDELGNLIVQQHLTNKTDEFVSFNCLLFVPGRRRERRQVFNLARGRTTNVFVLPQGSELVGRTLGLRAEEIGGARILNQHLTVGEY
jgi:hypothetical protein